MPTPQSLPSRRAPTRSDRGWSLAWCSHGRPRGGTGPNPPVGLPGRNHRVPGNEPGRSRHRRRRPRRPTGKGELEFDKSGLFCFSRAGAMRALFHDCDRKPPKTPWPGSAFSGACGMRWRSSTIGGPKRSSRSSAPTIGWSTPTGERGSSRERLGVDAIELAGGHSPWLSRPSELADLIVK